MDAPLIVAFLQGKQSPTVEFFGIDSDPNKLAATWRVFFHYGAALGDFRAAYQAKGGVGHRLGGTAQLAAVCSSTAAVTPAGPRPGRAA